MDINSLRRYGVRSKCELDSDDNYSGWQTCRKRPTSKRPTPGKCPKMVDPKRIPAPVCYHSGHSFQCQVWLSDDPVLPRPLARDFRCLEGSCRRTTREDRMYTVYLHCNLHAFRCLCFVVLCIFSSGRKKASLATIPCGFSLSAAGENPTIQLHVMTSQQLAVAKQPVCRCQHLVKLAKRRYGGFLCHVSS